MVESYSVQSRFVVAEDELVAVLQKQARAAREVGEAIARITGVGDDAFAKLASAAKGSFSSIMDVSARLDAAIGRLGGEAATAAGKFKDSNAAIAASFDAPIRSVSRLQDAVNRLNSTPIKLQRTGGSGGGGTDDPFRIPAVPGGARSWYSIHDAARAAGTGDGGGPGGPNNPWGPGGSSGPARQGGHGGGGDGLMLGLGLGMVGEGIGDAVWKSLDAGGDLIRAQNLLKTQIGNDPTGAQDYKTLMTAALGVTRQTPQIKLSDAVAMVSATYGITGNVREAAAIAPPLAAYEQAAGNLKPGRTDDSKEIMRAAELGGWTVDPKTRAIDPARIAQFFDLVQRAMVASGGTIDGRSVLAMYQTGGQALKNLSVQGFQNMMPLLPEFGGPRLGTAATSLAQQVRGGVMTQRALQDWIDLHLIDTRKIHATRTGVRLDSGAIKGADQLATDPVGFVERTIYPAMVKAGWSPQKIQDEVLRMIGRGTDQRLVGAIISQAVQYAKDVKMQNQATGTTAMNANFNSQDLRQQVKDLTSVWTTFEQVLGASAIPVVIPALQDLTKAIQFITGAVETHPTAGRDLLLLGAGIAGLAVPIGSAITAIGLFKVAMLGFSGGLGGGAAAGGAASEFGVIAGTSLASRLALAAPGIGLAIATAFLARFAFLKLDDLITGSAPPNVSAPRDGYHAVKGVPAPGSATGTFLGNLWHDATTGTGGRTIGGRPIAPASTGGVISLPAPAAPAPAASTPSHDVVRHGASGHGDTQPIHVAVSTVLTADGKNLAAVVTHHQVQAMRQPRKGPVGRNNRQNPSMPSQAVKSR